MAQNGERGWPPSKRRPTQRSLFCLIELQTSSFIGVIIIVAFCVKLAKELAVRHHVCCVSDPLFLFSRAKGRKADAVGCMPLSGVVSIDTHIEKTEHQKRARPLVSIEVVGDIPALGSLSALPCCLGGFSLFSG